MPETSFPHLLHVKKTFQSCHTTYYIYGTLQHHLHFLTLTGNEVQENYLKLSTEILYILEGIIYCK